MVRISVEAVGLASKIRASRVSFATRMRLASIILWLLFVGLAACSPPIDHKRNNEISKVCLATAGCMSYCPLEAVQIDSSGRIEFYGGLYSKRQGYYTGILPRAFLDTLNLKLDPLDYTTMDTTNRLAEDGLSTEVVIYRHGHRKHFYFTMDRGLEQDSLSSAVSWVFHLAQGMALTPSKDTLRFETTFQVPPPFLRIE